MVTWNANSIKNKLKEFKNFLFQNDYDIAGVCETKTDKNFTLKIPGYKVYLNSRNNHGGGVLIAVKENIVHNVYKVNDLENIEFVGIKITSHSSDLIIGQAYKPPNKKLLDSDLKKLFNHKNIIVMGDLNCKRKEWNCQSENKSGQDLLNFCLCKEIIIAAPVNPTNFPTVGTPSVIDFYLLKTSFNYSLPITKVKLSSDHNPVEIKIAFKYVQSTSKTFYDYSKADWPNFRKDLNNALYLNFHIKNRKDVENKAKEFSDQILKAINDNIPLKKVNLGLRSIPEHLKSLISLKNRLRKKLQKRPSALTKMLLKSLEKVVRKQLQLLDSRSFEKYVKKLNFKDGSIYKFTKRYTKKIDSMTNLLDKNNQELNSDKLRVEAFAEHFASMSSGFVDLGSKTFTKKVKNTVETFRNQKIDLNEVELTTFREITQVIKSLKNNKAAGHDEIGTRVLKNLPRKAIVFLIKLTNGILYTSHFPDDWKISKVIPLPKKNKNKSLITSYRPISLLPHISKIVEKIIKIRMTKFISAKNILAKEQFGFRTSHSTTDQLARLINKITENFNKKLHTGALLLDIESAFPSVWLLGIIYKLIFYGFPVYLILLIDSYLEKRKMFVSLNGLKSNLWNLLAGVPQGSVLGPLLFLIFINDAPKIKSVEDCVFADDKLSLTASYRISAITKRLHQTYEANKRFFNKWKVNLNPGKTEAIIFTKRRPVINSNIYCDGNLINWSKKVKYLGVVLDHKLNFGEHIKYLNHKAIGNLITLYPIFKNKFLNVHSKLILYKSLVRSAFSYACPVWSMTCQTNLNKLQTTQNKFLRIIGNFRKFTPISEMHESLNVELVTEHITKLTKNYFEKIVRHPNSLVRDIIYDKNKQYTHKRIMHLI